MRNIIIVAGLALFLFAMTAVVSQIWLTNQTQTNGKQQGEGSAKEGDQTGKDLAGPRLSPSSEGTGRRSTTNSDAENTNVWIAQLREKQEKLQKKEDQIGMREKMLGMVEQDIRSERETIDRLRKEATDEVKAASSQVTEAERRFSMLDEKSKDVLSKVDDLKKKTLEVDAVRSGGIKRVSTISDSMNPIDAASIIQVMAETDNLDTAAQLLAGMKECLRCRSAQPDARQNPGFPAVGKDDRLETARCQPGQQFWRRVESHPATDNR